MTITGVSVRWRYFESLYVVESIRSVSIPFHCLQVKWGRLTKDQLLCPRAAVKTRSPWAQSLQPVFDLLHVVCLIRFPFINVKIFALLIPSIFVSPPFSPHRLSLYLSLSLHHFVSHVQLGYLSLFSIINNLFKSFHPSSKSPIRDWL